MKLSEYSESSAGIVGSPNRTIRRSSAQVGRQRQPAALDPEPPGEEGGPGAEAAEQDPGRAPVGDDDEPDGDRDRRQHVCHRQHQVGAGALVEAQQRQHVLPQRQHPEAEDRQPRELGVGAVEQRLGDRAGEREGDQGARGRGPEQRRERGRDDPPRVLAREIEEAQQGLDQAKPDEDAGRDQRGEHDLGGTVVGRRQVGRVDRQQGDRDQLREHARGRVGGPRRGEAAQVLEHRGG